MAQIQTPSNPYVAGSPVSRPEMFFGRSDVFEFVRNALVGQHQDNVIVLYGKRRTGKTSVLYQMHRNIEPKYLPILIDLQALTMDSVNGFFFEIASTVQRGLHREFNIEVPRPDRADFESDPLEGFEETFMGQVTEAIGDRHLLLMIDEAARLDEQVQAQKLPPDVFGHLRSLMQHNASLNFIFSVGERLERMKSQYALLFTVALYKGISFLDRKSAESLISEPAQPLYSYEDSAVDRIIEITSGHAYFMQLLCHSIFAQWQREGMPKVTVDHVNRVATEVVERGSANVKFDWDDTSSVDKLVLSAMAEALDEQTTSVTLKDVQQILEGYDILVPRGDLISAQRSLIGKELVSDAADSRYTIDFLRLWVRQHQNFSG
jgi:Cdc6-like AAA superfamily ATPase